MSYRKLARDRGCTASCDECGYALGSGATNSLHWVKYLRGVGWLVFRRRSQPKQCWCSKPECQQVGKKFLDEFERRMKDVANELRREKNAARRAARAQQREAA